MQRITSLFLAGILFAGLLAPQGSFAAAKKYQVTGVVTALTDDTITVLKADGDKWEVARDSKSVIKGELKVGAKITIQYSMMAASVDVKPAK